jgi:hypothetical protein
MPLLTFFAAGVKIFNGLRSANPAGHPKRTAIPAPPGFPFSGRKTPAIESESFPFRKNLPGHLKRIDGIPLSVYEPGDWNGKNSRQFPFSPERGCPCPKAPKNCCEKMKNFGA